MPIFSILLLVGVAYGKFIFHHNDEDTFQPFVTPSQSRRICVELCMAGLGGKPCGDSCNDIMPQELPVDFSEVEGIEAANAHNRTRSDACTVLCPNQLGFPLCGCTDSTSTVDSDFRVDFVEICSYFCLKHKYQLYGCQSCQIYEKTQAKYSGVDLIAFQRKSKAKNGIDWEQWCKQQCLVGNGGAACNCDILPFSLTLK